MLQIVQEHLLIFYIIFQPGRDFEINAKYDDTSNRIDNLSTDRFNY